MTTIALTDLTTVFDTLMAANKVYLDAEFSQNRIKGTEYSTVYLGSLQSVMQTALAFVSTQQKIGLEADLLAQQILNAAAEKAAIEAKTALTNQQKTNAETENLVLQGQKCKLDAEYDVLGETKLKTASEKELLNQKIATERAQILNTGVASDSVIGKQKALYEAQTKGFQRDAEQKAAKIFVDTWNARRMTNSDLTDGNTNNKLADPQIGAVVAKLAEGIGVTI